MITYIVNGKQIIADSKAGKSLLTIGLEAGVPIEHACGGNGFCTTCVCTVTDGADQLKPMNDNEENMGTTEPDRLTCQAVVKGDQNITVTIED